MEFMSKSEHSEGTNSVESPIDATKLEFLKNRLVRIVAQNMDSSDNRLMRDVVDLLRAEVKGGPE